MIDRVHWINKEKLAKFILDCQVLPYLFVHLDYSLGVSRMKILIMSLWIYEILRLLVKKIQDIENGGISDRPDDACDAYHTYFGVAGI